MRVRVSGDAAGGFLKKLIRPVARHGRTGGQATRQLLRKNRDGGGQQPWSQRDPRFEYGPGGKLASTTTNIRAVMEKYGIKLERGARIRADRGLRGAHGETVTRGNGRYDIRITPHAFVNEEQLARTIYHENIHVRQLIRSGHVPPKDIESWERVAHRADRLWWLNHPLRPRGTS